MKSIGDGDGDLDDLDERWQWHIGPNHRLEQANNLIGMLVMALICKIEINFVFQLLAILSIKVYYYFHFQGNFQMRNQTRFFSDKWRVCQ